MKKLILLMFVTYFVTSYSYAGYQILVSGNTNVNVIKGNGIVKNEVRELKTFNEINSSGAFEVKITAQKKQSLEIIAEENILKYIITEVKNNVLFLSLKKSIEINKPIKILITMQQMNAITHSGASNYTVSALKTKSFSLNSGGSGKVILNGECDSANYNISGASNLNAKKFKVKDVKLVIQGDSKINLYASSNLNIEVYGMGDITYYGNPKVTKSIMGMVNINKGD